MGSSGSIVSGFTADNTTQEIPNRHSRYDLVTVQGAVDPLADVRPEKRNIYLVYAPPPPPFPLHNRLPLLMSATKRLTKEGFGCFNWRLKRGA